MSKKVVATFVLELLMVGVASVSQATTVTANISVDDAFEMYVSTDDCQIGTLVCKHDDLWDETPCEIPLVDGVKNYIHIKGWDVHGVIAGVIGDFELSDSKFTFGDGTQACTDKLLSNTTDWKVYTDKFCGTVGTLTDQGANGEIWGNMPWIDPTARWVWTGGGHDLDAPRYFSTVITPKDCSDPVIEKTTVPLTGIITTKSTEWGTDLAQFKLKGMQSVKDEAAEAIVGSIPMTLAFGKTCEAPIYKLDISASDLNTKNSNQLRYTEGKLDVVRCVYSSGECVVNIKNTDLKSLVDSDGKTLNDLLTGPMTVCLTVGKTTYSNSGTWTQHDSVNGSVTKFRKDIATETK